MKKIFFWKVYKEGTSNIWAPFTFGGCFWRFLLFLLLLLLMLFLLSLFRMCSREVREPYPGGIGWNDPIPGGEEVGLPAPGNNIIPPYNDPIPNPNDGGVTQIYPDLLFVIIDAMNNEGNADAILTFASEFTQLYPRPEHEIVHYNTSTMTLVLTVPIEERDEICQNLPDQITDVKFYIVSVEKMETDSSPATFNDPAFNDDKKSWYFSCIQAEEAWDITQGSPDVIVGIVDSYMDLNHPELQGDRCIYPYSVNKMTSDVAPGPEVTNEGSRGHGTMVTSIAVGNADNNEGAAGIAPKCKFIPVSADPLTTISIVEGMLYCIYHGASVVNLSLGTAFPLGTEFIPLDMQIYISETSGKVQEQMWDYIFDLAEEYNVTIVWAAGNENCYIAMDTKKRNPNTIKVSAVDTNLRKADFSNYGNFPERNLEESTISAPGVSIFGALPDNSYDLWDGTSFSAPITTGAVALLRSLNRDLTTSQIIEILQSTGKPVEGATDIGPLLQIKDALEKVMEMESGTATSQP